MKTVNTTSQISPVQSTRVAPRSLKNATSSKTKGQTSKIRNFGWLVTGMVEACHQISADDLVEID